MNRQEVIEHVLNDLHTLKNSDSFSNQYAIDENIIFFESIKSFPQYVKWLITRAPKLQRESLLELTDFPFPHWDREMHTKLVEIEKKSFPGLVKPLVDRIVAIILKRNQRTILCDLGCGGMEIERQILKKLLSKKFNQKVLFIGIDKSQVVHEVAKRNLHEVEHLIDVFDINLLDQRKFNEVIETTSQKHAVIMCRNDVFELPNYFPPQSFDIIFHSLFKHHLNNIEKNKIDEAISKVAKIILEYDGYRNWKVIPIQSLTIWKSPVLLNATIFSDLRYQERAYIKKQFSNVSFLRIGTYLAERGK